MDTERRENRPGRPGPCDHGSGPDRTAQHLGDHRRACVPDPASPPWSERPAL